MISSMACLRNTDSALVKNVENKEQIGIGSTSQLELALQKNLYLEKREFDIAIKYLDTLIRIDSLNGQLFYERGYCKAQTSKYKASSIDYFQALNLNFKPSQAFYCIGLNELGLGRDSLAILYFNRSLEIDPTNTNAKEMLNAMTKTSI